MRILWNDSPARSRDNAPMESFWGSIKQEWLDGQHFRTRSEAKSAMSAFQDAF